MLPLNRAWSERRSFIISARMMDGSKCPHSINAQQWVHPHQQTEGVFDFLKHVGVFSLRGWLGPQCQQTLCAEGADEVVGTPGKH